MATTTILRTGLALSLYFVIISTNSSETNGFCLCGLLCGTKTILDEDIDFDVKSEKDPLLKYKYVLIASYRIVGSRKKTSKEVNHRLCIPSEGSVMREAEFPKLVAAAQLLLKKYSPVLSNRSDYTTTAYNYRFLQWLKFSMRKDNEMNTSLESDIHEFVQIDLSEIYQDMDHIHETEFLRAVSFKYDIERKSLQIKDLAELRTFGIEQDQMVGFCRLLGEKGEEAVRNENVEMPSAKKLTTYENIMFSAGSHPVAFKSFFKKNFVTVLQYLYQTIGVRSNFSKLYRHNEVEKITLPPVIEDPITYSCKVMALFNDAMGNILEELKVSLNLHNLENVINKDKNRRVENFNVDVNELDALRMDPSRSVKRSYGYVILQELITEVLSNYNLQITKFEENSPQEISILKTKLPNEFVVHYSRVVRWLNKQMQKTDVHYEKSTTFEQLKNILKASAIGTSLKKQLKNILESAIAGSELKSEETNIGGLPAWLNYKREIQEDVYLKITTKDELNSFYKNGEIPKSA